MNLKARLILTVVAVVIGVTVSFVKRQHFGETQSQKWEREHNMSAPGEDPRMKAAEAEARRRWPEFVTALGNRKPNHVYAVKGKFTDGDAIEWMWVQVDAIHGNSISGVLDNDPIDVHNVKAGDKVTIAVGDIDDWIFGSDPQHLTGGFTSKVMTQIDAEQKR